MCVCVCVCTAFQPLLQDVLGHWLPVTAQDDGLGGGALPFYHWLKGNSSPILTSDVTCQEKKVTLFQLIRPFCGMKNRQTKWLYTKKETSYEQDNGQMRKHCFGSLWYVVKWGQIVINKHKSPEQELLISKSHMLIQTHFQKSHLKTLSKEERHHPAGYQCSVQSVWITDGIRLH